MGAATGGAPLQASCGATPGGRTGESWRPIASRRAVSCARRPQLLEADAGTQRSVHARTRSLDDGERGEADRGGEPCIHARDASTTHPQHVHTCVILLLHQTASSDGCDGLKLDHARILAIADALGNPHRLRIVAALAGGREYVSELARRLGLSRPLLYMHLEKLEAAGLVRGALELSEDGKAMKYYELDDFDVRLTPKLIADAVKIAGKGE
jgi:DNA-binding transcriptional ArsR family regulator